MIGHSSSSILAAGLAFVLLVAAGFSGSAGLASAQSMGEAPQQQGVKTANQQQPATANQTTTTAAQQSDLLLYSAWGDTIFGGELPVTKGIALNAYLVQETNEQGNNITDAFAYDGQGYNKIPVGITLFDVDPANNTGMVEALWMDREGNQWRFVQSEFKGGQTVFFEGVDENGEPILQNTTDPVAVNGFHHGATAFSPSLPVVFAYLATWGPADVWKNGEKFGTVPGHLMITNGVREPGSWKVWANENQTAIYDPQNPTEGYADPSIAQAHVIFFPPEGLPYHLMFHDIEVMD